MKTSTNGINLIKFFEGCELTPYEDRGGVLTVGYGHLTNSTKPITEAQAEKFLKKDLESSEGRVSKYVELYGLSQFEFDALVSFDFNTGAINQLTQCGQRTIGAVWKKMLEYINVNKKPVEALKERRSLEAEYAKCQTFNEVTNFFEKHGIKRIWPDRENTVEFPKDCLYKLKVGLAVREKPWGKMKDREEWTADGKAHDVNPKNNYLDKGTKVTNIGVSVIMKDREESVWMQIPSGYICARRGNAVYVEPCRG